MFEPMMAVDSGDFAPWPTAVPVFDSPDSDDIDWDAWQAELEADPAAVDPLASFGGDPDRVLSADELLVRAATEPPLLSAATLALIAPHALDDDGRLALAAGWARVENAAA